MGRGARLVAAALLAGALLQATPAAADPPPAPPAAEGLYDPGAHGGLSYGAYLRMTRGTRRRSTGMMIAGIILTAFGAVGMGAGTGVFAAAGSCDPSPLARLSGDGSVFERACNTHEQRTTGMSVLLAGAIIAGMGVPLWIAGASDVPWLEGASLRAPRAAPPAWARLVPTITPAPRGASIAWRF